MSPSDIEVLLHYYYSPEEHPRVNAPAIHDGVAWMLDMGLLKPRVERGSYGSSYEATDRGKALIEAWCSQPLPVQVWVIPERKEAA